MKVWYNFLCAKKKKITTLFNNFFSSVSVSGVRSGEYHDAWVGIKIQHDFYFFFLQKKVQYMALEQHEDKYIMLRNMGWALHLYACPH